MTDEEVVEEVVALAAKLRRFYEGQVITELEASVAAMPPWQNQPRPLEFHPYYEPYRKLILAWLDDGRFDRNALFVPVAGGVGGVLAEGVTLRTTVLRCRQKVAALRADTGRALPAPRTDAEGFYWWWSARDDHGRYVAGRTHFEEFPCASS